MSAQETLPQEGEPWETEKLPDFTMYGFHTGRHVEFRLNDGRVLTGIYQGYGVFGKGIWP